MQTFLDILASTHARLSEFLALDSFDTMLRYTLIFPLHLMLQLCCAFMHNSDMSTCVMFLFQAYLPLNTSLCTHTKYKCTVR